MSEQQNIKRLLHDVGGVWLDALGWADYYLRFSRFLDSSNDVVLMYHSVGEPDKYGNVSVDRLRRDLTFVTERYDVVDLPAVLNESDEKRVALTFDDAYQNFYTKALPLIREFEVPVTVFVPSAFIGEQNPDLLWRLREPSTTLRRNGSGEKERANPFPGDTQVVMADHQIRELVDEPLVTIGNHTRTHRDLVSASTDQLSSEIRGGKQQLEERFDITVDRFSYPYGRFFEPAERIVQDTHRIAVTTDTRPVPDSPDPHRIPRLPAHLSEPQLRWETTDLRWHLSTI